MDDFRKVIEAAGPRPTHASPTADKNRYAMGFANAMAVFIANGFRHVFPEIKPDPSGGGVESPARAVRGLKRLDINYGTSQAGLGLGISLKSVHVRDKNPTHRYHHNLKRNDEELRVEASGYHQRQPYAVLVAVVVLPIEACLDGGHGKPSSFGRWVEYLWPLADREGPHDDFDRFERAFVALYDAEKPSIEFFDVKVPPPFAGRPENTLSFGDFVEDVIAVYETRNSLDFKWMNYEDST